MGDVSGKLFSLFLVLPEGTTAGKTVFPKLCICRLYVVEREREKEEGEREKGRERT